GRVESPLQTRYRGYDVYKAGFWTQGPVLLQTLNMLSGFDLKSMGLGSADTIHTVTEAMKLAFDDRDVFYGDPDFSPVPAAGLLSMDYAASRRALIDPKVASKSHRPGFPDSSAGASRPAGGAPAAALGPHGDSGPTGDTTAVNAADASGNLFS